MAFLTVSTSTLSDSYSVTGQTQYYGNTSNSQFQIYGSGTQSFKPYDYTYKGPSIIDSYQKGARFGQEQRMRELQIQLLQQQLNGQ